MSKHILVVDDDDRLRALLSRYLREHGFLVSTAESAAQADELLALLIFDLMVLDVMMPGETGLSYARRLKQRLPVLFLSALGDTDDRLQGLEAGGDDYLAKPFEPKELLLRIHAILRRAQPAQEKNGALRLGEYVFERRGARLSHHGQPIALTTAEAALLTALARTPGEAISREALAESEGTERSVDVTVARLRKKMHLAPNAILTVRGAGYTLNEGP